MVPEELSDFATNISGSDEEPAHLRSIEETPQR